MSSSLSCLASPEKPRSGETYASFDGGVTFINLQLDLLFGPKVSAR